ncbi:MAG: FHA domain-containing protein [Eubacteriales bacterium]|nr:FHA domain-containing protein [Lachnospiraceae bacterium]MDO5127931.1 FHA domain-containing protein [Eubacteriales bacterium]
MDLKKCKVGHFYDGDKFSACPHCKNSSGAASSVKPVVSMRKQEEEETSNKTISKYDYANLVSRRKNSTESPSEFDSDNQNMSQLAQSSQELQQNQSVQQRPSEKYVQATNTYSQQAVGYESVIQTYTQQPQSDQTFDYGPVVGWLVGISGSEYGKSHELYAVDNTVGCGSSNVVVLRDKQYVYPENHAVISYDFNMGVLYINYAMSVGAVFMNGMQVTMNMPLDYMTTFQVGDSVFMVVPLCRDGFNWWPGGMGIVEQSWQAEQGIYEEHNTTGFDAVYETETSSPEEDEAIDEGLTNVLISSPWRCSKCNVLNAVFVSKCRNCGKKK